MNLIDAIKSGRPFRRQLWGNVGEEKTWIHNAQHTLYGTNDVLADDWETLEPKVTITRSQFWEAVADTYKAFPGESIIRREHAELLARKLGLEETP